MKVGDTVWIEASWQMQIDDIPLVAQGTIVSLGINGIVDVNIKGNLYRYWQYVVHEKQESLVGLIRERLQRDVSIAHERVVAEHEALEHAEAQLSDFTKRYVK